MVRSVWFLGFLVLAQSLFGQAYPSWFWTLPGPGWTVVFAKSDQEALSVGADVLTAYSRSMVLGNFEQLYDDTIDDKTWQNTDYNYVFDEKASDALLPQLAVAARYPVQIVLGQYMFLVGPKDSKDPVPTDLVDPAALSKPAWADLIGTFDQQQGRWLGVGRFSLQGNPADAWVKAEELAVFHMLQTSILQWGHEIQNTNQGDSDSTAQIEWIRLHYLMSDLRIDGRWVDAENNLAMVAVSAPKDSIRQLVDNNQ